MAPPPPGHAVRFEPYPLTAWGTITVPGTPKQVVKDPQTGALWVVIEVPGPSTPVSVMLPGVDLPPGAHYVGSLVSDGTLFVVTAGPGEGSGTPFVVATGADS